MKALAQVQINPLLLEIEVSTDETGHSEGFCFLRLLPDSSAMGDIVLLFKK